MLRLLLAGACLAALTGVSSATPLLLSGVNPGILNGSNYSVQVNTFSVANGCINFYNGAAPDATCTSTGPAVNHFTVNAPSDAIFGTVGVTTGSTLDFAATGQTSTAPPSSPYTSGVGFIVVNGITFDINQIVIPNVVPCPPATAPGACSSGDFVFTQLDFATTTGCPAGFASCGHVSVSFSANGIGYTGTSATGSTPYTFSWSSQFTNETIPDLINKANAGSIVDSVSFTASPQAVPEPAGFLLVGLGLLGVSTLGRRMRRSPRA